MKNIEEKQSSVYFLNGKGTDVWVKSSVPTILNLWSTIVLGKVNPLNKQLFLFADDYIQFLIDESEAEKERVQTLLIEGLIDKPKIKDKQGYIQINQALIIRLLDKIYSYLQNQTLSEKTLSLYNTISQHLQHTLDFIEDFFSNYFNRNEKVPDSYLNICKEDIQQQLKKINLILARNNTIDKNLANIIIRCVQKFANNITRTETYKTISDKQDFLNELLVEKALESNEAIRETLYYLNFNEECFISYEYNRLKQLTDSQSTKKEKIALLRFEQKLINQQSTKLKQWYSTNMPSLKEQLNVWIDEEVKFLQIDYTDLISDSHERSIEKKEVYVHVPFKGSEIYLLHKAFMDAGGATGETYKSLFEKTGSHLTNKNQKGFSTESLQKCSDKVDYEAKENVKRFLQKMIRNIDSY
ncbi:MAG: hypothetical protein ABIO55_07430 [Ginsengibacter sp.]